MQKNVLVTGGAGIVGEGLVAQLRAAGHRVVVADMAHSGAQDYVRCDVGNYRELERLWLGGGWHNGYFPGGMTFDIVYHLGAEFGRWNGEDYYERLWHSNAVGTKNVLRLQERFGFKAVYFSSSEVYGEFDGVMSESVMDSHEVRQTNDYALSKWVNEQQVMNSARQFGTESVRVRLFNTYGPGEVYSPYRSVISMFCYRLLRGEPITVYDGHTRTSTYVDDCTRALASISANFKPGEVYNIAGDDYHTIEEAAALALDATGRSSERGKFLVNADSEPMTTMHKRVDNSKAKRDLEMLTTVPLSEGVQRTVDWMRSYYSL